MGIDVEPGLFDEVARAVLSEFPDAFVASETVIAPPRFPTLSFVEDISASDPARIDSSEVEKGASLTYTAQAFSDSEGSAKVECKRILAIVGDVMRRKNFLRTMCGPVQNAPEPTIYRMVARYVGAADENGDFYRR